MIFSLLRQEFVKIPVFFVSVAILSSFYVNDS